jgi:hypothetical protein
MREGDLWATKYTWECYDRPQEAFEDALKHEAASLDQQIQAAAAKFEAADGPAAPVPVRGMAA